SFSSMNFACGPSVLVTYYPKQRNIDDEMVGGTGRVLREERMESWRDIQQFADEVEYTPLFAGLALPGVSVEIPEQANGILEVRRCALISQSDKQYRFE